MGEISLNEVEIACVKKLAEMFEKGELFVTVPDFDEDNDTPDPLGIPAHHQRVSILEVMERIRVISDVEHVDGIRFFRFRITQEADRVARQIKAKEEEKKEPEDFVEQLKQKAKSNLLTALIIFAYVVIMSVAVFLAAVLTIVEKWIDLQKKLAAPP